MTRLEKIQKIKELLQARTDLTDEQRAKFSSLLDVEEAKEKANKPPEVDRSFWGNLKNVGVSPFETAFQNVTAGLTDEQKADVAKKGLVQTLDVGTGAGPTRMAIGQLSGAGYSGEELSKALIEGFPTGAEIVERTNKPEDIEKNPLWSAVKATGYDLADPGAAIAGAKLLSGGVKGLGKTIFKSGISKLEQAAVRAGKEAGALTDTMLRHNIAGGAEARVAKTEEVLDKLAFQNKEIEKAADLAGKGLSNVDKELRQLSNELEVVIKEGKSEPAAKVAQELKSLIDDQLARIESKPAQELVENVPTGLLDQSGTPITKQKVTKIPAKEVKLNSSELSQIKRDWSESIPQSAWDTLAKTKSGDKIGKQVRKIFQEGAEDYIEKSLGKETADIYKVNNKDMGNLLTVQKPAYQMATSEATRPLLSETKAAVTAASPEAGAAMFAGKALKSGALRTRVGQALSNEAIANLIGAGTAAGSKVMAQKYGPDVYQWLQQQYGEQK